MCCLFGLMDTRNTLTGPQKSRILSVLARECEVRGTDATGVAYNSGGKMRIYKRPVPAHKLKLHIPDDHARKREKERKQPPFPWADRTDAVCSGS